MRKFFSPEAGALLSGGLLAFVMLLCGIALGQSPQAALNAALVGQTVTLKVGGIHAAARVLLHPIDTRILNGAVQPRALDIFRGAGDFVLPPGTPVRVFKVEIASGAKDDILRLSMTTASGAFVSLAFPAPKGSLAAESSAQLGALVAPVFDAPALAAAPSAATEQSAAPVPVHAAMPPHPANTVVELPPAAPGYPRMHASRAAQDGCWWAPFVSQRFGIELAFMRCEGHGANVVVAESDSGITLNSPGAASPPDQVLTVETKPAAQAMEAAIKQQFIGKLKSPAARLSCRAECETKGSGIVTCRVIATGSYARLKKFSGEDAVERPCPGLMTNDALAIYFLARPAESETKFLLYSADDIGAALDEATIHFAAQP